MRAEQEDRPYQPETVGMPTQRDANLRVDAQRNLQLVLRAAREVFGTLGYGAPMEEVARRAGVGVGTVYRRFPSKDVLVRRIAAEETTRLARSAASALREAGDPWLALRDFLEQAMSSGSGCLLPPRLLLSAAELDARASDAAAGDSGVVSAGGAVTERQEQPGRQEPGVELVPGDGGGAELLDALHRLVRWAREVGRLRPDAGVRDVLLVLSVAAPPVAEAVERGDAAERMLRIMLDGLRAGARHPDAEPDSVS